jgi:outer membrane protein TolC
MTPLSKAKTVVASCWVLLTLFPAVVAAQTGGVLPAERLSLDGALELAVENNRQLQAARLEVDKAAENVAVARLRRLPVFETEVTSSQLLTPVGFSFPRGAFGEFAATGPIPAADTTVTVPQQPTLYVMSQVSQPLTQLKRIGLGIKSAEATAAIEQERTRSQQLALIGEVKRLYFAILQTESGLRATAQAIELYRELDRTLQVRVLQRVALRSDALDVQYRLAQEELTLTSRQNALASQKERLNQLLGRDVSTAFALEDASPISPSELDLASARAQALSNRPDVREARLKVKQAELDREAKRAERIPDVSLAVSYTSNFNISVLPTNLAAAGVQVKWEPFDWGRKGRELASKSHAVSQAAIGVREVEDQAAIEINSRFRTLAEKRALLHVVAMAQTTAREKLRVKTNQYQVQSALLTDVLQLRAELADADDRYQQALVAFWTAKADFEQAMGEEGIQ